MCSHGMTYEVPQLFKNGVTHIRVECAECGKFIKYKPQKIDDYVLFFGKYKGKMLKEVPISYLNWYIQNGSDKKIVKRMKLFLEVV